jgi:hypothetical protein
MAADLKMNFKTNFLHNFHALDLQRCEIYTVRYNLHMIGCKNCKEKKVFVYHHLGIIDLTLAISQQQHETLLSQAQGLI